MRKTTLMALLVGNILITGCSQNEAENSSAVDTDLIGTWLTNSCTQVTYSAGDPLNEWKKGVYNINSNGSITVKFREYSESSCSGNYLLLNVPNDKPALEYSYLGEELLQEGVQGHRIEVNFTFDSQVGVVQGFYTLLNDTLCFSNNINLNADSISLSSAPNTAIDFDECLTKLSQVP